jgi:hypothetical protein
VEWQVVIPEEPATYVYKVVVEDPEGAKSIQTVTLKSASWCISHSAKSIAHSVNDEILSLYAYWFNSEEMFDVGYEIWDMGYKMR